MKNHKIVINEKAGVIEVGKDFAKKASRYGSEEYRLLQQVRGDYPEFRVVANSARKKSDGFKGLTFEYMENHIKNNRYLEVKNAETPETEKRDLLVEFYEKCGKDKDGNKVDFASSKAYGEIKKWFLESYPVFEEQRKKNLKKVA